MPALPRLMLATLVLFAALVADGAAGATPLFADHECEVQGYVIARSDRGVTPADDCLCVHYHGAIPGAVPDRTPACGLGVVLRRVHGSAAPGPFVP